MGSLAEAVRSSKSFREVARRLGVNHHRVKRMIREAGLDVEHFDFGKRTVGHVGETFNKLTIQAVYKGAKGRWFCRCDCECGSKNVEKRLDGVITGHVPSCGCAYRERPQTRGANNPAFAGCGEILGSRMYWLKRGAERRGLTFEVTKEYLWRLFERQGRKCALSGVELYFGRAYYSHETTASLDRIDSKRGYVEDNVQWVHKDVNKIKRDLEQDYFLTWCRRISDHSRADRRP